MQILFGPEHDHMHIDPKQPGAYEWWYFDALSDDGEYALVVIFFLGTPMSPYYKAVVDGKKPLPTDWCGVFFSLHQRVSPSVVLSGGGGPVTENRMDGASWHEIAYAYNIYRDWDFRDAINLQIGQSKLYGRFSHNRRHYTCSWKLTIEEQNLWLGKTSAELEFNTLGRFLESDTGSTVDEHTWVCVAPTCRVKGTITLPWGKPVSFSGNGYHDHNFGCLPWDAEDHWMWGRGQVAMTVDRAPATVITYIHPQRQDNFLLIVDDQGKTVSQTRNAVFDSSVLNRGNGYGLRYTPAIRVSDSQAGFTLGIDFEPCKSLLQGPFYSRWAGDFSLTDSTGIPAKGRGVFEVFDPQRLCHPLWSRLMWTRIRRRPHRFSPTD